MTGRLRKFAGTPADALPKLVRGGERAVEAVLGEPGVLVHGRIDALYGSSDEKLEVIEYKLTDEANEELDRAQVTLYRELLRKSDTVEAQPVILRFLPTLRETAVSAEAADAFVEKTIHPLLARMMDWAQDPASAPATLRRDLCAGCPLARPCAETYPATLSARDDPPMAATRPRPGLVDAMQEAAGLPAAVSGDDEEGQREAEALKERILLELKRQGTAAVATRAPIVGPTLYLIEVSRPRGSVSQLDRAAEDVRHRLAASDRVQVDYEREGGHRRFVVRRPKPRKVVLGPLLESKRDWLSAASGRFVVGRCPDGTTLCGDLAD